jgi:hypothetical protein
MDGQKHFRIWFVGAQVVLFNLMDRTLQIRLCVEVLLHLSELLPLYCGCWVVRCSLWLLQHSRTAFCWDKLQRNVTSCKLWSWKWQPCSGKASFACVEQARMTAASSPGGSFQVALLTSGALCMFRCKSCLKGGCFIRFGI